MIVSTYSNDLDHMTYDCWKTLWETRGFIPKKFRTAETGKDGHRTETKPIMTGERLAYDSKKDCFELYWYVRGGPGVPADEFLVFRCYRNMWRLYPLDRNGSTDWNSRGKIARINKYCPLSSWMHIHRGEVRCMGYGKVLNGALVTKSGQMQRVRNTASILLQSLNTAFNLTTDPTVNARGINVPERQHRFSHDMSYAREKMSNILDAYIDAHMEELFLKCASLSHEKPGGLPEGEFWPSCGYFKHKIKLHQHREDSDKVYFDVVVITHINGSNVRTGGKDFAHLFGVLFEGANEAKRTSYASYPYSHSLVDIERRYRNDRSSGTLDVNEVGPSWVMRHITSYFYMRNIFTPLGGHVNTDARDDPDVCGLHGMFFMSLFVYCAESIHDFQSMLRILFGKPAAIYLNSGYRKETLVRVAKIFASGEEIIKSDEQKWIRNIYLRLFSGQLLQEFAKHVCNDRLKDSMKNMEKYKYIMRQVFDPFLSTGVDYSSFGLSPYMAHVGPGSADATIDDMTLEHGNSYAIAHACGTPTETYPCQTTLLAPDSIVEENPLVSRGYFSETSSALTVSDKKKDGDAEIVNSWVKETLDLAIH
jgi:hypothetical protein